MKRLSVFYVGTILVALAVILLLLRAGAGLPGSQGLPLAAPDELGALVDAPEGVRTNLENALSHLFIQLLVIIVASRLMGTAARWFGQPEVVGEMAAGILLGPSLFGLVAPSAYAFVFPESSLGTLRLLSQIGVCLFMFAVGMELNEKHVRSTAHAAVAVSHASIVLPFLLGVSLAYFFYSELAAPGVTFAAFALFMGISMSITAFPILARILQERGLSRTFLGSTAITCAAVGDVTAWTIMAFVVAVGRSADLGGAAMTLFLVVVFVGVMILVVRPTILRFLGDARLAREDPSGATLATVLCVVVAAALATEVIGIHALFGAFLAGAIMPDVHGFRRKVALRVENFSAVLLLPLFFAYMGLRTQIGLLDDAGEWLLCLLIIGVATVGKLAGSAVAARLAGLSWSQSLQLGALMNTRGLMELIALNIGYDMGILSPQTFVMLVVMALATTTLTGPLLTLFARREALGHATAEPSGAR
jgi:Kef-type K+ transport system membrane component KefB